eukprot:scaffold8490_cov141-Skeletonema_menzelii.AAC.3
MEQSEIYKQQQQEYYHSKGFGDFPPTPLMRQPQPSSRIRFADDTKPYAREYDNISLNRRENIPHKSKQVLVLDGDGSMRQGRQQYTPNHNNNMSAPPSIEQNNRVMSSSTPPSSQANNTLDFSMIATPGGQRHARVMVNDETASYTSESSSHFATPFTNMLRGVVSSTPGILTSATEAAMTSKHTNKSQNDTNNDQEGECTAITFAKSASHSGYLKKLGKNIHSFKRRFFVLKPSTHLYYFMSPNDVEPRGCIDLDNFIEGSGGCQVNEIGVLPDGTFRFELVFDEEEQDLNDAILNEDDENIDNILETKNGSNRQSIVLEARTEEIGRDWIAKIKSERLSVAKGQVDQLQTSLAKSEVACAHWEESASDEKRRANEAELSRNVAIAEAKSWEGRFRDLNEAIRLLVRDTSVSEDEGDSGETSSSEFLRESLQGLELNGTNFEDVSEAFQRIRDDCNTARKKKEYANESIIKLQQRLDEAEERVSKAEAELAQVKEDAQAMHNDLKRVKREKKILVKEVKTLHENRRLQEIENNTFKQHQSDHHNNNAPSIRSNEDQRRLILELEEHVMSGLRLSEQFLHLNGIDPSEVGDDLDSSIQTSSKASDISPLRRRRIPAVIRAKPDIPGDDIDSTQASSKASDMSPLRQMQNKPNASPLTRVSQFYPSLQRNREMSNLLDDDDDDEEMEDDQVKPSDSEVTSRTEQGESSQVELQSECEKPVKQNLNEIFAEEPQTNNSFDQAAIQSKQNGSSNDASNIITNVASFQSSESAPSKVTDNGHATTQLVKAPQDARSESSSSAPTCRDGGVYHITFYRKRLGLQFQKVPNEMGTTTGLLTNVMMTADGLDAPETTATELQRIASLSHHSKNRGGKSEMESIVPVSPVDAVIVCGFIGFDDSSGSIRPKVGARLVAFDGIPVEVGRWTFESIRKGIQARSRPLTLSFRNDPLSPKQQDILKKALADIAAAAPPPQSIPANLPRTGSRGESHHQYLDEQSLAAASTDSSTASSQRFKKHYSFSETGSSISSAVAPLVSNLMKKSAKQQQQQRQQQFSEPEYVRRQLSSHEQMRLDEFRSSML